MPSPERLEDGGVVVGCVLVAVLVVVLLASVADPVLSRIAFAAAMLAVGVVVGVVVVARDLVAYETVWSFALGAWVAATALVTVGAHGRLAVLLLFDTSLDPSPYRVLVLALAAAAGVLVARVYASHG